MVNNPPNKISVTWFFKNHVTLKKKKRLIKLVALRVLILKDFGF